MRNDLAHFTLDGRPLCEHSCTAYAERLKASGAVCEHKASRQLETFAALCAQFPGGRVALVSGACPFSPVDDEAATPAVTTRPKLDTISAGIFRDVCDVLQNAEGMHGPEPADYPDLMRAVIAECEARIANCAAWPA